MFTCLFKGHIWEHLRDIQVWMNDYDRYPLYTKRVYQCTRCLKARKVKL